MTSSGHNFWKKNNAKLQDTLLSMVNNRLLHVMKYSRHAIGFDFIFVLNF